MPFKLFNNLLLFTCIALFVASNHLKVAAEDNQLRGRISDESSKETNILADQHYFAEHQFEYNTPTPTITTSFPPSPLPDLAAGHGGNEIIFTTIAHGAYSGINEKESHVFRTSSSFENFWRRHIEGTSSPSNVPSVDFENNMIISVARGLKTTGGYGIEIKSVTETDTEILVYAETTDPSNGDVTLQALTQPFHIIEVQKSTKTLCFEIVASAPEPTPYPLFILSYDDTAEDPSKIAKDLMEHESLVRVDVLNGIQMFFVYFDKEKIAHCAAKELLIEIVTIMDGIEYLEADPLEQYWRSPCDKNKTITSSVMPSNTEPRSYYCNEAITDASIVDTSKVNVAVTVILYAIIAVGVVIALILVIRLWMFVGSRNLILKDRINPRKENESKSAEDETTEKQEENSEVDDDDENNNNI